MARMGSKEIVIVASLLAALGYVAVQRVRSHAEGAGQLGDGKSVQAELDAPLVRHALWEAPSEFAPRLAAPGGEARPALSPDGRFLVFASGARGADANLFLAPLSGGVPGEPRPIAALDTPADELAPAFSGAYLYFASDREGGRGGLDLYRARFVDGRCEAPERLDEALQSPDDDTDPAPARDDGELVFARTRGAHSGLWRALLSADGRAAEGPSSLAFADAREPALSADGRVLWFRAPGGTSSALWRALWLRERWQPATRVEELDSELDEGGPCLAANGFELVFTRAEKDAAPHLFRALSREVYLLPARPWTWFDTAVVASLCALALAALLARRWPALDLFYKCLLVSVLVHLLLLFLMRYVFLEGGEAASRGDETHRVRFVPSARAEPEARSESGARAERPELAASAAPVEPASTQMLASAPAEEAAAAPERGALEREPAPELPRAEVALAGPKEELRARGGAAPALPLEAAGVEDAPVPTAVASPAANSTLAGPALEAPKEANAPAPQRSAVVATLAPSASEARVALAQPREGALPTRGGAAPGLELEPSSNAGSAGAPAQASIAGPAASSTLAGPTPAAPGLEAASAPARTGSDAMPSPAASDARVALEGPRAEKPRPPAPSAPAPDLLTGLSAARDAAAPKRAELGEAHSANSAPDAPRESLVRAPELPREEPRSERKSWDHTPYENRAPEQKARALALHGGDEHTEEAVARGLDYLARIQQRGGNWGRLDALDGKYGQVAVGKTGLALLAFLGAGHTQLSNTAHSAVVARAVDALLALQDPASGHFGNSDAYGHGIATYALAEDLALTGDARVRAALGPAVRHILAEQDRHSDPRLSGGWSYYFADGHVYDRWPRTAISAWQVMALESARLSGIEVPDAAFEAARGFLENARDEQAGNWRYNHDPQRLNSDFSTLPASTPAAMFALALLGDDLASQDYAPARAYVLERAPSGYRFSGEEDFVLRGAGNLYFWYYGTLAMFRAGGEDWKRWNEAMKRTLLPAQNRDGSWEPIEPYARFAQDSARDKSYTSALCVLSLEVYYRYYLPLLRVR